MSLGVEISTSLSGNVIESQVQLNSLEVCSLWLSYTENELQSNESIALHVLVTKILKENKSHSYLFR